MPYLEVSISEEMVLPIKRIVVWTESHDQGWSSFPYDHGTYRNSQAWFEAVAEGPSKADSAHLRFQENVHASNEWRKHMNIFDRRTASEAVLRWMDRLTVGSKLQIWAKAAYHGWENHVRMVQLDVFGSETAEAELAVE